MLTLLKNELKQPVILPRSLLLIGTPDTVLTACIAGPEDMDTQPGHPQEARALGNSSRAEGRRPRRHRAIVQGCNKEDSTTGKGIVCVGS